MGKLFLKLSKMHLKGKRGKAAKVALRGAGKGMAHRVSKK